MKEKNTSSDLNQVIWELLCYTHNNGLAKSEAHAKPIISNILYLDPSLETLTAKSIKILLKLNLSYQVIPPFRFGMGIELKNLLSN